MKGPSTRPSELIDLAESLRLEGRLSEALSAVEQCLQESPGHPRGLLLLGRLLVLMGRHARALEALGSLDLILGKDDRFRKITATLREICQETGPGVDSAFVTQSMAELHVKQGYLWEGIEIYKQLYLSSGGNERLWERILDLRERLRQEGARGRQSAERLEALNQWIQNRHKDS